GLPASHRDAAAHGAVAVRARPQPPAPQAGRGDAATRGAGGLSGAGAAARSGRGTAPAPGAAARILGDAGVPVHPADHVAGAAPVCLERASLSGPATAGVEPEFAMARAEAVSPPIVPVILSGGSGTRLWPLSRSLYPKQFLPLASERTLLQETL